MRKNFWAIIGMGFISSRHIQAIHRIGDEVLLTCDIDPEKKADYTDWVLMMRDPKWKEVTHVAICTPNYLHYPMMMAIQDKTILCEKPMAIESRHLKDLGDNVNGVLQLRYHPKLQDLAPETVSVTAKMFRDDTYWQGWKGDQRKSGGVLFNLGVHYIDLLIFLLGDPVKILKAEVGPKVAKGKVEFMNGIGEYHIEILDNREGQIRKILVDGEEVSLSDKDNLSYEDLHWNVYNDLKNGIGTKSYVCSKSIKLIEQIYKKSYDI